MEYGASIKFLWADLPVAKRVAAAAAAGFDAVELWDWRGEDMDALHAACKTHGIRIGGCFGHASGGLRDPAHRRRIVGELAQSVAMAERYGIRQLALFSDEIRRPHGEIAKPPALPRAAQYLSCIDGIEAALKLVEGRPVTLMLEAINTVHVPGYFWDEVGVTIELCRMFNHPQLRLAFDCFHQQLVGGRLTDNLIAALPYAARIDIGNVPGRHQPGIGEIDFAHIRRVLEQQGY
ncbi:MAG: hypothetical protein D6782_11885, partial [Alphaproteobacteria bacterium]